MEVKYKDDVLIHDPDVEAVLAACALDADAFGRSYRGHVYRVLNYVYAQVGEQLVQSDVRRAVSIAAACHDLEVFRSGTWDYLDGSVRWMRTWLAQTGLREHADLAELLVRNHHLLRVYHGPHRRLVEAFRRADLMDFPGWRRFTLSAGVIQKIRHTWPAGGFHRRLWWRLFREALRRPWNPAPMVRLRPFVLSHSDKTANEPGAVRV